jgi:hypothetical protein
MRAFNTLTTWLTEEGWEPQPIEGKFAFWARYASTEDVLTCYFQIFVEREQYVFYAVPTLKVPTGKRKDIAEFIIRVNHGMRIGNFDMDFETGELNFKSSINFRGELLSVGFIEGAIGPSIEAIDLYLPGIVNVIQGVQSPIVAINSIDYGT